MKKILLLAMVVLQTYGVFCQIDFNQSHLKEISIVDTIPFQFVNNSIIVEVMVNDKMGHFIVDTGAPTIVDQAFYEKLDLPALGSIRVRSADDQVAKQDYILMPELSIQQVDFLTVPALVIDLEQTPMKDSPIKIDGMIGSNLLKDLRVKIDLSNKILVLTDKADHFLFHKNKGVKIKLDENYRPFVPINVGGKKTQALFDTGFNGLYAMPIDFYHFHQKFFLKHALKKGGATSGYSSIYGDAAEENLPLICCPYLKIGVVALEKVVTLPFPGSEGLLGTELLEEGEVILDYLGRRFYFSVTR